MSGLLLELRRQIAHNRRKAAYEERMRASAQEKPQEVFSQKTKEIKPDTEIQPEVQERKVNVVSREDFLLSQIDEFRDAPSSYSHCLIPERRRHRNCRR